MYTTEQNDRVYVGIICTKISDAAGKPLDKSLGTKLQLLSRAASQALSGTHGQRKVVKDEYGATIHIANRQSEEPQMFKKIVALTALSAGGFMLSKHFRKSHETKIMSVIEESLEVDVPVSTAYNQWTQFTEFPKFMKDVREVRQLDPTHLHWRAVVAGKEQEWDSEITEQIPDTRIAWHSTSGTKNTGVVTFHKISDSTTRIMLQMDYAPHDVVEEIGDALGLVKMETRNNLKCFKEFLEGRGKETGAWRGAVPQQ